MSRYKARESAFKIIFEYDFNKEKNIEDLIEYFCNNEENKDVSGELDYMRTLLVGASNNITELDKIIQEHSKNWSAKRISKVTIAMLRLALYEIIYMDDISEKVSINEAVEIIKKYDSEENAKFANGVLGGYLKV